MLYPPHLLRVLPAASPGEAQLGIGICGSVTRSFCVPCLKFLNLKLVKYNLQSVSLDKNTAGLLPPPLQTGRGEGAPVDKTLPATSGPEKGGSDRAARDQDLPGCPCRVTGPGVENWRDAGGRQVLSRGQCEWKDVVVGREERKMNGA